MADILDALWGGPTGMYAERLGALGQLREARDRLLCAKVLFDEAGAHAWTHLVDALLLDERVEPSRSVGNPALLMLADHERALAHMVARGMRNKEIAAKLFVGEKAISKHISSIFTKLGLPPSDDDHRRVLAVLAYCNV